MDATRWKRIQALFHDASALPAAERRAFVAHACGDDAALAAEVLSLLAEDVRDGSLLDDEVAHVAHELLDAAAAPALPPDAFGPYRITGVLGEGGMGVVYLAERADLGSRAAIKILRDAWLSPARRDRFASEQRMLAQLNHPSIARLYDANTLADGTPWFVMEYVDGVPLTAYCAARACSVAERLRLFRDVCEAVQHAHQHAVIHRDLKPSNILVAQPGHADAGHGAVKLLDFGIAKQLESVDTAAPADRTRTGLRLMTPAYAAPEQIRGSGVGVHTDVYALGVVLYELLTGRLPFDVANRTPSEIETMIVEHEPVRPSAVARAVVARLGTASGVAPASRAEWADLDVLCLTAMHKDPARRYRTVDALVRDLDHLARGEPLEARPDSRRYKAGKFVRRNWRPLAVAAAVLLTVAGLTGFYTVRLARARDAALAEVARRERVQDFMTNLFQGGDETVAPPESLLVVTLVDRGLRDARSLSHEPLLQADLYATLGGIYHVLGRGTLADSLLRLALAQRTSILGAEHAEAIESLVSLGVFRTQQGDLEEGERLLRDALRTARRALPPEHPNLAEATLTFGWLLQTRGEQDSALVLIEEGARLFSLADSVTPALSVAVHLLANAHYYAGRYDVSDSLNRRALAMSRQLFGDRHPYVAEDLLNIGVILHQRGEYQEAERFGREGLDIVAAWYGDDHPRTAAAQVTLARALIAQDRVPEAVGLLQRALAFRERVFGPAHPDVASVLNDLGFVAQSAGRLDEAEALYVRMADIYRSTYGERHRQVLLARSHQASVLMDRGDNAGAERMLREVVARYAELLPADHPSVGMARMRLGRALVRQQRYAEGAEHSLAAHRIIGAQAAPTVRWLVDAREDLVTAYEALGQPERAAQFRAEQVAAAGSASDSAGRR